MGRFFTEREKEVLEKFKNGGKIEENEEEILDDFASVGFVSFGFLTNTAKLTPMGHAFLRLELKLMSQ
ncbi:MAG: hypothetical protein CVT88_04170 [Candidatus Altiarchaeales archaeon HGW-Altiarchaeales-1]|nr:MAG: hypothetical protein CVT89_02125 [Candidatus Altiarchaeales archaeon HGW-Altiarchaeales-2]PKP60008.1 MAG: hypothetical protein CVT88_04170 [Candidatus Altiarchaeales archaeon HGW-Altiarchaeales-1]